VSDWSFLPYALFSGSVIAVADLLYVYALSKERISLIAPLYNMNVVFLLFTSAVLAHDSFTALKFLGTLIIFGGVLLLQKGHFEGLSQALKSNPVKAILFSALLFAVLRSVDALAFKVIAPPPFTYAFVMYSTASLLYLLSTVYLGKLTELKQLFFEKPKVALASGFVNGFSYVFLLFALSGIQVSVAEPIAMLCMPLAVLIAKKEFNEKQNWSGVVFMLVGSWLLFF
jgi:transporter family protein